MLGPIQELEDRYIATSSDVACSNFFGRMFTPLEVPWTSIDVWTPPARHNLAYPVEILDIRVAVNVTAGRGKQGVQITLGRMKENKGVVEWLNRHNQGTLTGTASWAPHEIIYWPVGWLIKQGGCIAGDFIDFYMRYRTV